MKGYLLDANHVGAWETETPAFMAKLDKVPPETLVRVCTVTLGEYESGLRMTEDRDPERRRRCRAFIDRELRPYALDITVQTSLYYATIMEQIWQRRPPPHGGRSTAEHLRQNGVQINDLWVTAVAFERGLTLLTTDHMTAIREAAPEVVFETWV